MNIVPLFANPLGWDFIDIDNDTLADWCYQQEHTSLDPNTEYGWQSGLIDVKAEPLRALVEEIKIEKGRWHRLDTRQVHSVENLDPTKKRISLSLSIL